MGKNRRNYNKNIAQLQPIKPQKHDEGPNRGIRIPTFKIGILHHGLDFEKTKFLLARSTIK